MDFDKFKDSVDKLSVAELLEVQKDLNRELAIPLLDTKLVKKYSKFLEYVESLISGEFRMDELPSSLGTRSRAVSTSSAGLPEPSQVDPNLVEPSTFMYGNNVIWGPAKSKRNVAIMRWLTENKPKLASAFRIQGKLRSKFPLKEYGAKYVKRGSPEGQAYYGAGGWADASELQKRHRNEDGWIGPGYYSNAGYGAHGSGRITWDQFKHGVRDVGRMLGPKIVGAAENAIVGGINRLAGSGAYVDDSKFGILGSSSGNLSLVPGYSAVNQLINHPEPSRQIRTVNDETNSIVLTHSEYIGDIKPTTTSFETQVFLSINPGLAGTFPWLSNLAQFYEEYEFRQLAFSFKSMVTEGNASAAGTVIMATQYNPANPQFNNKQVMENYDYANSSKVTLDAHHGIECDASKHGGSQIEYVRTGAIPSNQDLKTYDLATFQLATTGAVANLTIGELWVSYQVVLRKTKIPQLGQVGKLNGVQAVITGGAGAIGNNIFASNTVVSNVNGFSASANTVTFPTYITSGNYVFVLRIDCTTLPTVQGSVSSNNGLINLVTYRDKVATTSADPSTDLYFITGSFTVANTTSSATSLTFNSMTALVGTATFELYQVYSAV